MKVRKKPVEVEAWQFEGNDPQPMPDWIGGDTRLHFYTGGYILIDTLEGQMRADKNDWIIRGVKGEVYPCKPDIFEATYERV